MKQATRYSRSYYTKCRCYYYMKYIFLQYKMSYSFYFMFFFFFFFFLSFYRCYIKKYGCQSFRYCSALCIKDMRQEVRQEGALNILKLPKTHAHAQMNICATLFFDFYVFLYDTSSLSKNCLNIFFIPVPASKSFCNKSVNTLIQCSNYLRYL